MASTSKAHSLHVDRSQLHHKWSNSIQPVLTIDSGSEISFDLLDGGGNQITDLSTIEDVVNFDTSIADPAFGPVYVNGSEPGDVLKIEFLELECATYGWTAMLRGFGLLADDFPDPALKIWDLSPEYIEKGYAVFKQGIHIPIRPFLGVVGVAPGVPGEFSTIPPWAWGGNIDCKHITKGSVLYLPVQVPGALFSCGDGHAAQGDGEVCGTAIETPMKARVRLTVEKDKPWVQSPHYLTNPAALSDFAADVRRQKGEYGCLGIDADLLEASKKACRYMIDWLVCTKGLTRTEACMLISVAGDLKIVEAVDMPHYAVAMSVPLGIFVEQC